MPAVTPNATEMAGNNDTAQKLLYPYGNYSPLPNMLAGSSPLVPRYPGSLSNIPTAYGGNMVLGSAGAFPPNVTITSMQGIPRYNPYSLLNSNQNATQITPNYSYNPFSSLSQKFCLPTI